MALYACGWKGFIEVRAASRKPSVLKSEVSHKTGPGPQVWDPSRTIKIRQLCFKGGDFWLSLPKRIFYDLTKLSVPVGAVILVPARLRAELEDIRNGQFAPQTPEQTPHPVAAPASMRPPAPSVARRTRTSSRRASHATPETEGLE